MRWAIFKEKYFCQNCFSKLNFSHRSHISDLFFIYFHICFAIETNTYCSNFEICVFRCFHSQVSGKSCLFWIGDHSLTNFYTYKYIHRVRTATIQQWPTPTWPGCAKPHCEFWWVELKRMTQKSRPIMINLNNNMAKNKLPSPFLVKLSPGGPIRTGHFCWSETSAFSFWADGPSRQFVGHCWCRWRW
jgi:hypothetical protein